MDTRKQHLSCIHSKGAELERRARPKDALINRRIEVLLDIPAKFKREEDDSELQDLLHLRSMLRYARSRRLYGMAMRALSAMDLLESKLDTIDRRIDDEVDALYFHLMARGSLPEEPGERFLGLFHAWHRVDAMIRRKSRCLDCLLSEIDRASSTLEEIPGAIVGIPGKGVRFAGECLMGPQSGLKFNFSEIEWPGLWSALQERPADLEAG